MFCKRCSAEQRDGAKFCNSCGAVLDPESAQAVQPAQPPQKKPYCPPVLSLSPPPYHPPVPRLKKKVEKPLIFGIAGAGTAH